MELAPRPSRVRAILLGIVRPLAAGLLASAAGIAGWWMLTRAEDRLIDHLAETEAQLSAAHLESVIRIHVEELERMARRWEQRPNPVADDWKADVIEVKRQTPAFRAIEWREPSLVVRWAAPLTAVGPEGDLDSLYDDRRVAALTLVSGAGESYVSPSYFGSAQHRHISVVAPMKDGDSVSGYLVGVARVRDLVDEALHQELRRGYSVAIHEGPYLLYGPEPTTDGSEASRFYRSADVDVDGLEWKVEAWPGRQLSERLRSPVPLVLLSLGVMIGIFAAAVVGRPARDGIDDREGEPLQA